MWYKPGIWIILVYYRNPCPLDKVRELWLYLKKWKGYKPEARNPKHYLMTKIPMNQTIDVPGITMMILFLSLGHLIFEFISNFEIRISNFANARTTNHALWA